MFISALFKAPQLRAGSEQLSKADVKFPESMKNFEDPI